MVAAVACFFADFERFLACQGLKEEDTVYNSIDMTVMPALWPFCPCTPLFFRLVYFLWAACVQDS